MSATCLWTTNYNTTVPKLTLRLLGLYHCPSLSGSCDSDNCRLAIVCLQEIESQVDNVACDSVSRPFTLSLGRLVRFQFNGVERILLNHLQCVLKWSLSWIHWSQWSACFSLFIKCNYFSSSLTALVPFWLETLPSRCQACAMSAIDLFHGSHIEKLAVDTGVIYKNV